MVNDRLDLDALCSLVSAERKRRGLSLREAASDIGIPFNTLSRVEKGHIPDLPKFKRLVEWCGADVGQFFEPREKPVSTTDIIATHLRADRNLPDEAAEHIADIVKDLYKELVRPQEVLAVHLRAAKTFRPDVAHALGSLLSDMQRALVEENSNAPKTRI